MNRTEFFTIDELIMAGYNWVKENAIPVTLTIKQNTDFPSFDNDFIIHLSNGDEFFLNYRETMLTDTNSKILQLCCEKNIKVTDLINKQLLTFL